MTKFLMTAVAVTLFATAALAQTSADSQTSGSASTNTGVQADQNGAQVNNNAQTGASTETSGKHDAAQAGQSASTSQSASASPSGASASSASAQDATLNAVLTKGVDSKKAKQGDPVAAKTTQDATTAQGTKIPKNSKLVGHVTEAKSKAKGDSNSTLGFVFDKAVLKNGQEVPLHAVMQAVAAPIEVPMNTAADMSSDTSGMGATNMPSGGGTTGQRASNGGVLGGATNTAGGVVNSTTNTVGNTAGSVGNNAGVAANGTGRTATDASGVLAPTSTGVVGLNNVQLQQATSAAVGAATAGGEPMLTSTTNNVHLDSGTQLVLKSAAQK